MEEQRGKTDIKARLAAMTRGQRIGVILSVAWIIGSLAFVTTAFMMMSSEAAGEYRACLASANAAYGPDSAKPDPFVLEAARRQCKKAHDEFVQRDWSGQFFIWVVMMPVAFMWFIIFAIDNEWLIRRRTHDPSDNRGGQGR